MRPLAWAENMHKHGIYPIIITRNWDREIKVEDDVNFPSGKKIKHEKKDNYEVYYVPFKGNLEYRFINRFGRIKGTSRLMWEIQKAIGHFFIFNPYRKMFKFTKQYLIENKIGVFVLTVPPFNMLELGYRLNKATGVKWVADYRDEWHTSDMLDIPKRDYSGLLGGIKKIFRPDSYNNEKKWTGSSTLITTVAPSGVKNLQNYNSVKGAYIPNGFFEHEFDEHLKELPPYKVFTITYAGWLYQTQQIEILLGALNKMYQQDPNVNVRLLLVGGKSFKGMESRINKEAKEISHLVELTDRKTRAESFEMQMKSQLLLLCSHKNAKGIPSSKLYEYIALRKPVLVCPGDDGIIDQTIKEMQNGFICNSIDETVELLQQKIKEFEDTGAISTNFQESLRENYTREIQTKEMAKLLKDIE